MRSWRLLKKLSPRLPAHHHGKWSYLRRYWPPSQTLSIQSDNSATQTQRRAWVDWTWMMDTILTCIWSTCCRFNIAHESQLGGRDSTHVYAQMVQNNVFQACTEDFFFSRTIARSMTSSYHRAMTGRHLGEISAQPLSINKLYVREKGPFHQCEDCYSRE